MLAERNDKVLCFYSILKISKTDFELEALFVDPKHIGTGIGKALLSHAREVAASLGEKKMMLQSDPNAAAFYLSAGAIVTGKRESPVFPGRFLPTFCFAL